MEEPLRVPQDTKSGGSCLFMCIKSRFRAIHRELIHDNAASAFINCLMRFASQNHMSIPTTDKTFLVHPMNWQISLKGGVRTFHRDFERRRPVALESFLRSSSEGGRQGCGKDSSGLLRDVSVCYLSSHHRLPWRSSVETWESQSIGWRMLKPKRLPGTWKIWIRTGEFGFWHALLY